MGKFHTIPSLRTTSFETLESVGRSASRKVKSVSLYRIIISSLSNALQIIAGEKMRIWKAGDLPLELGSCPKAAARFQQWVHGLGEAAKMCWRTVFCDGKP
jgi:hypothetical protein